MLALVFTYITDQKKKAASSKNIIGKVSLSYFKTDGRKYLLALGRDLEFCIDGCWLSAQDLNLELVSSSVYNNPASIVGIRPGPLMSESTFIKVMKQIGRQAYV